VALGPQEQLHVARRYWIQRGCPRCNAEQGKDCVLVEGPSSGKPRKDGHVERLQLIVDERKASQKSARQQKEAGHQVEAPARPMQPAPEACERELSPTRPLRERRPKVGREGQAQGAKKKIAARLHHQVPRGDWYRMVCPRCHAGPGKLCDNDDRVGPARSDSFPTMNACAVSCRATSAWAPVRGRRAPSRNASTRPRSLPRPIPGLLGRAGQGENRKRPQGRRHGPGVRRRLPVRNARPARTPRARPTARTASEWSGRRTSPASCGAEVLATAAPGRGGPVTARRAQAG
jgi:hypothetical protein